MSILAEFKKKITMRGLEWFGRYYGSYRGFVVDNNDPDKNGRLKIRVPQIYGESIPEYWAWSKGMMSTKGGGVWMLPEPGDPIWIEFENGDVEYPIWNYGWYSNEDGPKDAGAKEYIMKTPAGNIFQVTDNGNKILFETADKVPCRIEISNGKFKIEKEGVGSLHGTVDDILTQIQALTVPTLVGPSLIPLNVAEFVEIQTTWNLFMK